MDDTIKIMELKYNLKVVAVAMVIVWISLLGFFYLKADEITKDPCSICAEKYRFPVSCYVHEESITYHPNGTITEVKRIPLQNKIIPGFENE